MHSYHTYRTAKLITTMLISVDSYINVYFHADDNDSFYRQVNNKNAQMRTRTHVTYTQARKYECSEL